MLPVIYTYYYRLVGTQGGKPVYKATHNDIILPEIALPSWLLGRSLSNGHEHPEHIRVCFQAVKDTQYIAKPQAREADSRTVLKSLYPINSLVLYEISGARHVGRVLRHNRKTISISNEGPVVTDENDESLEWDSTQSSPGWRISWTLAMSAIIDTVNPN